MDYLDSSTRDLMKTAIYHVKFASIQDKSFVELTKTKSIQDLNIKKISK